MISGANVHDIKHLEELLDCKLLSAPKKQIENLCLDAGYRGVHKRMGKCTYTLHIRSRGKEKQLIEQKNDFKARRWIVEVVHSWFNRFRKILVRFEKKAKNYLALLHIAAAIICFRKCIVI